MLREETFLPHSHHFVWANANIRGDNLSEALGLHIARFAVSSAAAKIIRRFASRGFMVCKRREERIRNPADARTPDSLWWSPNGGRRDHLQDCRAQLFHGTAIVTAS